MLIETQSLDIRTLSQDGQVIYIRMAASEAEYEGKKWEILIASLVSVMGVVSLVLALSVYVWRKRKNYKIMGGDGKCAGGDENDSGLPFWELTVILRAMNHFSSNNKLGEGGFGPVYKIVGCVWNVADDGLCFH